MEWIWLQPKENEKWGAAFDHRASDPVDSSDCFSDVALNPALGLPVFRSAVGLKRFRKLHCPPFSIDVVVDKVWRDIILEFVPTSHVQFYPVRLIARGETTDEFSWVIPFDRVKCIDLYNSNITDKIEKHGKLRIMHMNKFIHVAECMNGIHLARDVHLSSHLLVSNQLKEALAATGESSMFYRPEQLESYYSL